MWLNSKSAVVSGVVLCCALVVPTAVRAQVVKAGFNSSTITFHPESGTSTRPGTDWRAGFVGGVSFLVPAGDRTGLQLEALIGQTGAGNVLRVDDALRVTSLSFPVLFHAKAAKYREGGVYLIGGVAPTLNVHATYTDEGVTETVTGDIKTFDLGLVVGGGFEHRRLVIEGRYTWGLLGLFDDGDGGAFKSGAVSVMAGFKFGR